MKKNIKKIGFVLLAIFLGMQIIPRSYNLNDKEDTNDILTLYNAPKEIETLIKTSCYDCHSNNTKYPWYNKIQPIAWFMQGHIKEGKEELNFSEFATYSKRKQKSKIKSILSQIKDDEMPLWSYSLIHRDAKLSAEDKKMLEEWLNEQKENLTK